MILEGLSKQKFEIKTNTRKILIEEEKK